MAKVRVYNDNKFPHTEKFRGEYLTIEAGQFIEMEREDAVLFKSAFVPPRYDKGGLQKPESYKMIRLETIKEQAPDAPTSEHICQACGFTAATAAGLKSHIRSQHAGQMLDDDARQDIMKD